MTDEIKVYAFPGDVVQLSPQQRGTVLDWTAQLPMNQRQFSKTHYPIGPIGAPIDSLATKFWPMSTVTIVSRAPLRPRPDDLINDRVRF